MEVQSLISFDLDPGPVDQSVLVWQHEHRSAAIWEDEVCVSLVGFTLLSLFLVLIVKILFLCFTSRFLLVN